MKKLYILAPNNRFNYGDLLFPYIIKHYIGYLFDELIFCSTTVSDLSAFGGIPTNGYEILFDMKENSDNYIIVGGGECFCTTWGTILSYTDKTMNRIRQLLHNFHIGKLQKRFFNYYVEYVYKPRTNYPFTVGKKDFQNVKAIMYNSVGGVNALSKDNIQLKQILESIDYISVRDTNVSSILNRLNIPHKICADSAILMSEIFPKSYLIKKISENNKHLLSKKYLFFQIGRYFAENQIHEYSRKLRNIYHRTGMVICLCPIGTAMGHEDHIALEKIHKKLSSENICYLIKSPTIWDIMGLISHSQIYVGTSLHGTITSMSYGISFVCLGPRKLKAYVELWCQDSQNIFCSDLDDLESMIMNNFKKNIQTNVEKQKESVVHSFERMKMLIEN